MPTGVRMMLRIEVPGAGAASTTVDASQSNALSPASGGQCDIPGYPRPADVATPGAFMVSGNGGFSGTGSLALQAAGATVCAGRGQFFDP